LGRAARNRGEAPELIDHCALHADLGVGGEALHVAPGVALRAVGERYKTGLDEVFGVDSRHRAALQMPGELADHRQEALDDFGGGIAVSPCGGGASGADHAAMLSIGLSIGLSMVLNSVCSAS